MITHPAKFSDEILAIIGKHARGRVLDPFAGTGRVHRLRSLPAVTDTVGVELEPEWAGCHPATIVGNALTLPFPASSFDTIATSPCYGNRLADHHNAQDGSTRHSYTHDLGRALHPDNAGALHFGDAYCAFHRQAWREARRVLRPGGLFIVNVSDFIRGGRVEAVVAFHRAALRLLDLVVLSESHVAKRGLRHGANRERVDHESVLVYSYGPVPRLRRPRVVGPRAQHVAPELPGQLSIYDVLGGET